MKTMKAFSFMAIATGLLLAPADKATAHRARSAVYELPSPKRCWEPEAALAAALPEASGPRARVLALQKELA